MLKSGFKNNIFHANRLQDVIRPLQYEILRGDLNAVAWVPKGICFHNFNAIAFLIIETDGANVKNGREGFADGADGIAEIIRQGTFLPPRFNALGGASHFAANIAIDVQQFILIVLKLCLREV